MMFWLNLVLMARSTSVITQLFAPIFFFKEENSKKYFFSISVNLNHLIIFLFYLFNFKCKIKLEIINNNKINKNKNDI